jgi:hypothetical protein
MGPSKQVLLIAVLFPQEQRGFARKRRVMIHSEIRYFREVRMSNVTSVLYPVVTKSGIIPFIGHLMGGEE